MLTRVDSNSLHEDFIKTHNLQFHSPFLVVNEPQTLHKQTQTHALDIKVIGVKKIEVWEKIDVGGG